MKKNKRAFLLIEIVIAMSLASVVFSFLFRSYFDFMKSNLLLKTIEETLHFEHNVYLRLNQIFDNIENPSVFPNFPAKIPIYTQKDDFAEMLCFIFNNGIDRDPQFSGEVLGQLYLKDNVLFLCIISKNTQKRIEISYKNISKIRWEFFNAQTKNWASEWPKEKSMRPLILKLSIKERATEKELTYCFFLDDPKVTYFNAENQ